MEGEVRARGERGGVLTTRVWIRPVTWHDGRQLTTTRDRGERETTESGRGCPWCAGGCASEMLLPQHEESWVLDGCGEVDGGRSQDSLAPLGRGLSASYRLLLLGGNSGLRLGRQPWGWLLLVGLLLSGLWLGGRCKWRPCGESIGLRRSGESVGLRRSGGLLLSRCGLLLSRCGVLTSGL